MEKAILSRGQYLITKRINLRQNKEETDLKIIIVHLKNEIDGRI